MNYITPNEKLHFEVKVDANHDLVRTLRDQSEVKKTLKSYSVDFDKGVMNLFKGISGFNIMFPTPHENTFLVVYFDEKVEVSSVKVMEMKSNEGQLEISFKDIKSDVEVKGIFQGGEYIRTEVVGNSGQVQAQGLQQCLQEGFESLPLALRAFCMAACGAVWTGVGLAACAGCLTGLGIHC